MAEPNTLTIGEVYGPAMTIDTADRARDYFDSLVAHRMQASNVSREEAESIERQNLGYFAGYCDHETRLRVERLFGAVHPILGSAETGPIDPMEAFRKGQEHAAQRATDQSPR